VSARPLLLAAVLAAGCDQSASLGSRWVRSQAVQASVGGIIEIGADDPALAGAALRLMPGDLTADALITVEPGAALLVEPRAAGPAVVWGPAGLPLARPALMTLPVALGPGQSAADLIIVTVDPLGHFQKLDHPGLALSSDATRVQFYVPHLGLYWPAAIVRCHEDADCGPGEKCSLTGECQPEDLPDGGHK
jgi:hypothetical protein